jgi:hypothetical protein
MGCILGCLGASYDYRRRMCLSCGADSTCYLSDCRTVGLSDYLTSLLLLLNLLVPLERIDVRCGGGFSDFFQGQVLVDFWTSFIFY